MKNYSIKIKQEESGNDILLAISINNIITYVLIDNNLLNNGLEIYHPDMSNTYFDLEVKYNTDYGFINSYHVTLTNRKTGKTEIFYEVSDDFHFADKEVFKK